MISRQDDTIIDIIDELERSLEELKGEQITGSDAVITYKAESQNEYDWERGLISAGFSVTVQGGEKIITFVPEATIEGRTIACFQLCYKTYDQIAPTLPYPRPITPLRITRLEPDEDGRQRFRVYAKPDYVNSGDTGRIRYKFYALATGKGSLTIADA